MKIRKPMMLVTAAALLAVGLWTAIALAENVHPGDVLALSGSYTVSGFDLVSAQPDYDPCKRTGEQIPHAPIDFRLTASSIVSPETVQAGENWSPTCTFTRTTVGSGGDGGMYRFDYAFVFTVAVTYAVPTNLALGNSIFLCLQLWPRADVAPQFNTACAASRTAVLVANTTTAGTTTAATTTAATTTAATTTVTTTTTSTTTATVPVTTTAPAATVTTPTTVTLPSTTVTQTTTPRPTNKAPSVSWRSFKVRNSVAYLAATICDDRDDGAVRLSLRETSMAKGVTSSQTVFRSYAGLRGCRAVTVSWLVAKPLRHRRDTITFRARDGRGLWGRSASLTVSS